MIRSFRHKGLQKFFETGSKAGIQPKHETTLRLQLTTLNAACGPDDMRVSGWKLHALHGDLEGQYAVWVSGNWRLIFMFEDSDALLVDYRDYH